MRAKTVKCRYCGTRFKVKARGRRPRYCKPSHRLRAFEKRKLRALMHNPFELIRSDVRSLVDRKTEIRRVLREILNELFPREFPLPAKRKLELIEGGKGKDPVTTDPNKS